MGKLIVDLVALLLAFLCLSGFVIWLARPLGTLCAAAPCVHHADGFCTASAFASRRGSDCYTTHSWFAARQLQPLAG